MHDATGPTTVRELFLAALAGSSYPTPLQLSRACVATLPVDRAAIVVTTATGPALAASSDAVAAAVEDAQLTLGAGPAVDAYARSGPVLVADLVREVPRRWPELGAATAIGGALYALPLQLGAIRVGVLDLYRTAPAVLEQPALGDALEAAELVTTTLLLSSAGYLAADDGRDDPAVWPTDGRDDREVHQATGMIAAQLETSVADAYVRLRARAFGEGRELRGLAHDVVARRVRFNRDGREGGRGVDVS